MSKNGKRFNLLNSCHAERAFRQSEGSLTSFGTAYGPFLSFLFIFLIFVIFLRQVFSGRLILPQSFHLGPLTIRYYGVILALAVAGGFYVAIKRAKDYPIAKKQFVSNVYKCTDLKMLGDLIFWIIVGGFIGARLYHVLSSAGYYLQHPIDIFKVWNGGLSIYGAVIGGAIALLVGAGIARPNQGGRWPPLHFFDWLTPSLILGQIIGRFGNLVNYEAYGYPTNLPWKMFVPESFRPAQYQSAQFFHPWFLYEALGNLVILFLLIGLAKKFKPGALFFSYLLLYNLLRFGLEFLRSDSVFIGNFRQNALASLLLSFIASAFLIYQKRHAKIS